MSVEAQLLQALGLDPESKKDFFSWVEEHEESCKEFYQFASSHDKLKVSTRQIPAAVRLPKTLRTGLKIQDVQVHGKRREPDDAIYAKFDKIRALVARGNTLLSFKREGEEHICFPLYGMKKFTGGMGDDDDQDNGGDNTTWQKFFTQPADNASHIIGTSKENGSAAHLSAIFVDGEYVLIGGSKNSHLICSLKHGEEDLKLFPESPWKIAKRIMQAIFDLFKDMGEANTEKFLFLLANWHLTAIFEMLDSNDQHVELLTNPTPIVRFITFTSAWRGENPKDSNELCLYPIHAVKIAEAYKMPTITYEVVQLTGEKEDRDAAFERLQSKIRQDFGNEGQVLYFATSDNVVIGLLKKKTLWYIILRALREKFKLYQGFLHRKQNGKDTRFKTLEDQKKDLERLIKRRLTEIQKWLGFSDEYLAEWLSLGNAGNEWLYNKLKTKNLNPDLLGNQFPVVWDNFLKATNSSDRMIPN